MERWKKKIKKNFDLKKKSNQSFFVCFERIASQLVFIEEMSDDYKRKRIDESLEENLKILEVLPKEEDFLKSLNEKEPSSVLPYLNRIHKIVHHILPKPNQV